MVTTISNVLNVVSIGALMDTLKYSNIVLIAVQEWLSRRGVRDKEWKLVMCIMKSILLLK